MSRGGLRLLSLPYSAGVWLRNTAFDLGLKRVHKAPVPVISVGNITAGGTGKTPLVAYLANWFQDRGARVVLLSRGYRALPGEVNDEKLVLDRECPGVPHLQDPDRVRSAEIACREHGADLLILDDGFQHRRLHRDLNVVLIDALNPWGYGRLLPRGLLRETVSALRRADVVVLTRADQCSGEQRRQIASTLQATGVSEWVEAAFVPTRLTNTTGETLDIHALATQRVAAFCGIGNPDGFRQTLTDAGYDPVFFETFPDHHHYANDELTKLASRAQADGATALLTTQKDLVKLPASQDGRAPVWAVSIGTRIVAGEGLLQRKLEEVGRGIVQR